MRFLPALLLLAGAPLMAAARAPEGRGLWGVRTALVSPAAVDRVVDGAHEGGIRDLFVQVRGRGDAFYESKLVGRSDLLAQQPAGFDPLLRLIERSRSRGLRVHAWVNVLLTAHFGLPLPPDHVVRQHPDWLMVPRAAGARALSAPASSLISVVGQVGRTVGEAEGYYLSPSAPGVPEHLEAVVRELVRAYPVDGLHLAFIRYPSAEDDYSRAALEQFRRQRGGGGYLLGGPTRSPAAWDEFRRGTLTDLARRLVEAARGERPGLVLSVAVVPDAAAALKHRVQDWSGWMKQSLFNAICPMAYTADNRVFRPQVEQGPSLLPVG